VADRVSALVNSEHPTGFAPFGMHRFHGPGEFEGFGFMGHFGLDTIADKLNLSLEGLRDSLAAGSTLAEIAEDQGVDTDILVDALLADLDEKLETLVADERLTQERADEIREGSAAMVDSMINGEMPGLHSFEFHHGDRFHRRGMPGPGRFFGPEDDGIDGADATA